MIHLEPARFDLARLYLVRPAVGALITLAALPARATDVEAEVTAEAAAEATQQRAVAPPERMTQDRSAGAAGGDTAALGRWPGVSLGWDVHAEAISMFKHYTIAGREAWYSGQGAGGGVSVSLHFRPPAALAEGVLRWVELEAGVGNSSHFVRWEEGERERQRSDFVDNRTYAIIGVHIATGRWSGGDDPWSGAVLGLAWVPTYVHFFGNDEFTSGGKFHHAGLRLSVDYGRISPASKGLVPGLRAFLTWLPYVDSLPTSVSAGVGCVFY